MTWAVIVYLIAVPYQVLTGLYDAKWTHRGLQQKVAYEGNDWLVDHYGAATVPYYALVGYNFFWLLVIGAVGLVGLFFKEEIRNMFFVMAAAGLYTDGTGSLRSALKWKKDGAK